MEKFKVAGTTIYKGATKVRFANDLATRVKTLVKNGHDEIELFELPHSMSKQAALEYLQTQTLSKAAMVAVADKLSEFAPKVSKPKATKKATTVKKVAPSIASIAAKAKAAKAKVATPVQAASESTEATVNE